MINKPVKNIIARSFIAIIVIVIVGIYYFSELRPFDYEGYEKNINLLQRYDAELNEAIVLTRFGLVAYYTPIDKALNGVQGVLETFKSEVKNHPNATIELKLKSLEEAIKAKEDLTQKFKRLNPILINAINQFSTILAEIIESQASVQLVESCLEQDYRYQVVDLMNNLFRGILIYINIGSAEQHDSLEDLVEEIHKAPQKFENLDLALSYASKILEIKPQMTELDTQLFEVPIVSRLNTLNNAYNTVFQNYLADSFAYRILLYILVFLLLVALRWTFAQLRGTVDTLHIEVQRKIKAEKELAKINRQLEQRVADRTKELTLKNNDLNEALADLKEAQDQLIIKEKMASVGMLTTGIAHEIKNPLNFVNNFSDLSIELVDELNEELTANKQSIPEKVSGLFEDMLKDLKTMCSKIKEHGVRADNIVKNMLLHSQEASADREMVNIADLMKDNYQIALQSFRGDNKSFEPNIEWKIAPNIEKILVAPQPMSRVFVYLFDNSFYALREKQGKGEAGFVPSIQVNVNQDDTYMTIKVRDNGVGIPKKIIDKVFEPFFTTKPTGKGNTGLGLSICYDTVVKQHKGELRVSSEEGSYTEFVIMLPLPPKKGE